MKFCRDCKHYRNNWRTLWSPYCARKASRNVDPVTGKVTMHENLVRCYIERLILDPESEYAFYVLSVWDDIKDSYCGNSAQFWEPKTNH